jgi:hypothetical protein
MLPRERQRIYCGGLFPRANEALRLTARVLRTTTIDNALTRPWSVKKTYRREPKVVWPENNCTEGNNVVIGKENYLLSADGHLMPVKKDQPPPDLRYFNQPRK